MCRRFLIALTLTLGTCPLFAKLHYVALKNNATIQGPFIKFNMEKSPYILSGTRFTRSDMSLKWTSFEKNKALVAHWPKYFVEQGTIRFYNKKNKLILTQEFERKDLTQKGSNYELFLEKIINFRQTNNSRGLHFCIAFESKFSKINTCSDKLQLKDGQFSPVRKIAKLTVIVNGHKVPLNSQINIGKKHKQVEFYLKMSSGMRLRIKQDVDRLELGSIFVDPVTQNVLLPDDGEETYSSLGQRIKKFVTEKNYFLDELNKPQVSKGKIVDSDIEFRSKDHNTHLLVYGLFLDKEPKVPPKMEPDSPIATYSGKVELRGTLPPSGTLAASNPENLRISQDKTIFAWDFISPEKGKVNKDDLTYTTAKGEKHIFTNHVYRGHRGSVAIKGSLNTDLKSAIVPGYVLDGDYWFEELFSSHPFLFQRWGVAVTHSQALSGFDVDSINETFTFANTSVDIMARFSKGVRPIQSSFGAGIRYFKPVFARKVRDDLNPNLMGVGLFWHSAPLKFVDDIVNIMPFFRFPKWLEFSAYYYPIAFSEGYTLDLAMSFHAKGRLMFSKSWFLDAGLNFHILNFAKTNDYNVGFSFAEGTIGVGYSY